MTPHDMHARVSISPTPLTTSIDISQTQDRFSAPSTTYTDPCGSKLSYVCFVIKLNFRHHVGLQGQRWLLSHSHSLTGGALWGVKVRQHESCNSLSVTAQLSWESMGRGPRDVEVVSCGSARAVCAES